MEITNPLVYQHMSTLSKQQTEQMFIEYLLGVRKCASTLASAISFNSFYKCIR